MDIHALQRVDRSRQERDAVIYASVAMCVTVTAMTIAKGDTMNAIVAVTNSLPGEHRAVDGPPALGRRALPILLVFLAMLYWLWRVRVRRSLRGIVGVRVSEPA